MNEWEKKKIYSEHFYFFIKKMTVAEVTLNEYIHKYLITIHH